MLMPPVFICDFANRYKNKSEKRKTVGGRKDNSELGIKKRVQKWEIHVFSLIYSLF